MRLHDYEIKAIKEYIELLDPDAEVYLFGSRANDAEKGGDIDLLVLSQRLNYNDSIRIRQKLYEDLGEQKIHLIIAKDATAPFVRMAYKKGVLL